MFLGDGYLVEDHGLVGKVNEWLRDAESQRPQPSSEASHEDERLHGVGMRPSLLLLVDNRAR